MVCALDSGSSSLDSSPGREHCVVFMGKTLYSLSYPGMAHPEGSKIFLIASCYKTGISFGLMGHLVRIQTLPFLDNYLPFHLSTKC